MSSEFLAGRSLRGHSKINFAFKVEIRRVDLFGAPSAPLAFLKRHYYSNSVLWRRDVVGKKEEA